MELVELEEVPTDVVVRVEDAEAAVSVDEGVVVSVLLVDVIGAVEVVVSVVLVGVGTGPTGLPDNGS